MIKRIVIRSVASYDEEGVVFDDLQKVNFIYGGNGTGKTTISRYLAGPDKRPKEMEVSDRDEGMITLSLGAGIKVVDRGNILGLKEKKTLKRRDFSVFRQCKTEWKGGHHELVVYNQDFKMQNLNEVMPGIFFLGPDMAVKMKRLYYNRRLKGVEEDLEDSGYETTNTRERLLDMKYRIKDSIEQYSLQRAITYINNTLDRIGFTGFKIRKSTKNPFAYEIVRKNGERADETLSEGEVTIITFLYFLQQVHGIGNGSHPYGKKIVVIDDPISSLDYDTIEVVSTLTNELMESARKEVRIEQVMVLTHNATYHQSLSLRQPKKETHYWRLYKKSGVSKAKDCGVQDPVKGDYEMMWMKMRKVKSMVDNGQCEDVMDLPNLMRKIIETYFVDFGGYNKYKLFAGDFVENLEDRKIVVSLMKWIDEGSHSTKDNIYAGNEEVMMERYMDAFRLLFESMRQGAHYRMMMRES